MLGALLFTNPIAVLLFFAPAMASLAVAFLSFRWWKAASNTAAKFALWLLGGFAVLCAVAFVWAEIWIVAVS
jgi:hypothetical protein